MPKSQRLRQEGHAKGGGVTHLDLPALHLLPASGGGFLARIVIILVLAAVVVTVRLRTTRRK